MQAPKVVYVASRKIDRKKYQGSRIISWSTKGLEPELKPCSHLCIILRNTLVIESTLSDGVRIIPYSHWIKDNEIVYSFEKPYEGNLSKYIPILMERIWGKGYDKVGILYFAWRILLFLFFRAPLPKVNRWDNPDKRFCVEIFGEKLAMTAPIQMVARWMKDDTLKRIK